MRAETSEGHRAAAAPVRRAGRGWWARGAGQGWRPCGLGPAGRAALPRHRHCARALRIGWLHEPHSLQPVGWFGLRLRRRPLAWPPSRHRPSRTRCRHSRAGRSTGSSKPGSSRRAGTNTDQRQGHRVTGISTTPTPRRSRRERGRVVSVGRRWRCGGKALQESLAAPRALVVALAHGVPRYPGRCGSTRLPCRTWRPCS